MAMRHGGNLRQLALRIGRDPAQILDFSASINPLGPPQWLRATLAASFDRLVHYPDPDSAELVQALAQHFGLAPEQIVVGNGSSEILFALARACPGRRAVIPVPSYVDYAQAARTAGRKVEPVALRESDGFAIDWQAIESQLIGQDLVVLGQPNNPTGLAFEGRQLLALAARHPAATFVVDEAFADFIDGYRSLARQRAENVVVMRSFTKFYAIPGLRLGFCVANAELAARIREQIAPWSVNTLAQEAALGLLADEDYARRTIALVNEQRQWLSTRLAEMRGVRVYPSQTNYLLLRLDRSDLNALELADRLLEDGIAVRTFGPGQYLDEWFVRVAVRTREENERLCTALQAALMGGPDIFPEETCSCSHVSPEKCPGREATRGSAGGTPLVAAPPGHSSEETSTGGQVPGGRMSDSMKEGPPDVIGKFYDTCPFSNRRPSYVVPWN